MRKGGYTIETLLGLRELELSVLWYGEMDTKWHVTNQEKMIHIIEFMPNHFESGLLSSPINMQQAMAVENHDLILAFIYVFDLREQILSFAKDRCTIESDSKLMELSHDLTTINLSRLEARLLEIRDDVIVPLLWRN